MLIHRFTRTALANCLSYIGNHSLSSWPLEESTACQGLATHVLQVVTSTKWFLNTGLLLASIHSANFGLVAIASVNGAGAPRWYPSVLAA